MVIVRATNPDNEALNLRFTSLSVNARSDEVLVLVAKLPMANHYSSSGNQNEPKFRAICSD
jgi:hypothetical protein